MVGTPCRRHLGGRPRRGVHLPLRVAAQQLQPARCRRRRQLATPKLATPKPVTPKPVTPKLVMPKPVTPKLARPEPATSEFATSEFARCLLATSLLTTFLLAAPRPTGLGPRSGRPHRIIRPGGRHIDGRPRDRERRRVGPGVRRRVVVRTRRRRSRTPVTGHRRTTGGRFVRRPVRRRGLILSRRVSRRRGPILSRRVSRGRGPILWQRVSRGRGLILSRCQRRQQSRPPPWELSGGSVAEAVRLRCRRGRTVIPRPATEHPRRPGFDRYVTRVRGSLRCRRGVGLPLRGAVAAAMGTAADQAYHVGRWRVVVLGHLVGHGATGAGLSGVGTAPELVGEMSARRRLVLRGGGTRPARIGPDLLRWPHRRWRAVRFGRGPRRPRLWCWRLVHVALLWT